MDQPPHSRQRLDWHYFEHQENGEWRLTLEPYYADLFALQRQSIMRKSQTGWRPGNAREHEHKYAYFKQLTEQDVVSINAFLTVHKRQVILGLNKHITPFFRDELDACVALDFYFDRAQFEQSRADYHNPPRSQIGEWECQARYLESKQAISHLVREMERAIRYIPQPVFRNETVRRCLSYVPFESNRSFYLPRELASWLALTLPSAFSPGDDSYLVDATLAGSKLALKSETFEQKVAEWESITTERAIILSRSVAGYAVYVIDDIYQSGATMWSYAKYLKSVGATQVFGLACVKSMRDTDNL